MQRAIIAPAALAPAALDELKAWLGISAASDDAALTALLRASLDLCEGFTGTMPLTATCEEVLTATGAWQVLATRPVQAITLVQGIPAEGVRFTLAASAFEIELEPDGSARVRTVQSSAAGRIAVRFVAGLAAEWASLPDALRHGVLRLAAAQYRMRDSVDGGPVPPAAVAALWRPYRRMRLS